MNKTCYSREPSNKKPKRSISMKLSMKWIVQSPYLRVLSAESIENSRSMGMVVIAEKVKRIDMGIRNRGERARCS